MNLVDVFRVALDTPLKRLFDYLPPEAGLFAGAVQPGMRVRVPFGRQKLVGIVMEAAHGSEVAPERLKPILEVLDSRPVLDASALALLRWAAEYYHHPIGEVLSTALPKAMRLGADAEAREEVWAVTAGGSEAYDQGEPKRAPKQRELLAYLVERQRKWAAEHERVVEFRPARTVESHSVLARDGHGAPGAGTGAGSRAVHQGVSATALDEALPKWREAARALKERGWVSVADVVTAVAAAAAMGGERLFAARVEGPELREEQRVAVDTMGRGLGRFGSFVLHGVTGSGKTEVYMRLVARVLEKGQRALVLVPEIGLTPQLVGRFRDRFDAPMAVLHSALTDHERLVAWRDAFSGHARIVLGTRSAVFAPVPNLGIIIIDEEHDPSFKQHEGGFRYSARDLAVVRAQRADVPVVLGSATPSLESLHNVEGGRYTRLSLPYRAAVPNLHGWHWWTCARIPFTPASRRQRFRRWSVT